MRVGGQGKVIDCPERDQEIKEERVCPQRWIPGDDLELTSSSLPVERSSVRGNWNNQSLRRFHSLANYVAFLSGECPGGFRETGSEVFVN